MAAGPADAASAWAAALAAAPLGSAGAGAEAGVGEVAVAGVLAVAEPLAAARNGASLGSMDLSGAASCAAALADPPDAEADTIWESKPATELSAVAAVFAPPVGAALDPPPPEDRGAVCAWLGPAEDAAAAVDPPAAPRICRMASSRASADAAGSAWTLEVASTELESDAGVALAAASCGWVRTPATAISALVAGSDLLLERPAVRTLPDEPEPASLPTTFAGGLLCDAAPGGIGAAAASAAVAALADAARPDEAGSAVPAASVLLAPSTLLALDPVASSAAWGAVTELPATLVGASPEALGVAGAGWPRTFNTAANPPAGAPAAGAEAPSLESVGGAVGSTAAAAIMGRDSVSGRAAPAAPEHSTRSSNRRANCGGDAKALKNKTIVRDRLPPLRRVRRNLPSRDRQGRPQDALGRRRVEASWRRSCLDARAKESATTMKSFQIRGLGLRDRGADAFARQFLPALAARLAGQG
jgi:hypothetical protein